MPLIAPIGEGNKNNKVVEMESPVWPVQDGTEKRRGSYERHQQTKLNESFGQALPLSHISIAMTSVKNTSQRDMVPRTRQNELKPDAYELQVTSMRVLMLSANLSIGQPKWKETFGLAPL